MPYSEKLALTFLKEMYKDLDVISIRLENVLSPIEQLYKKYEEFIEANPEFMCSQAFKDLEKDLKEIQQTCKLIHSKCIEAQCDITDCGIGIN